jgi:hypothetical protein
VLTHAVHIGPWTECQWSLKTSHLITGSEDQLEAKCGISLASTTCPSDSMAGSFNIQFHSELHRNKTSGRRNIQAAKGVKAAKGGHI